MGTRRIGHWLAVLTIAGLIAVVQTAAAYEPTGTDFRISTVGTDGDDGPEGSNPASAYNSVANEHLVVWVADGLATPTEFEIFGQRLSASGAELGSDFRISNVGADGDTMRDAADPAVAYNPSANEYLVTWEGDGLATDGENEIFGQRVSATGAELGSDLRISNIGVDGVAQRDGIDPAVAYGSAANEFVVTWRGDGLATLDEEEIFGQRVSAAGAQAGTDFRISNVGTDTDASRDALLSSIEYNPTSNEFLVIWNGDGLATADEQEVFGQRVSAAGTQMGTDFRISNTGTDGDDERGAFGPVDLVHNANSNEYLAVWYGDGLATDNESEIFGQRVSASGAELGGDFRISTTGPDGDDIRIAFNPEVAYSSAANEFLVAWSGDGLATATELEIFAQRISPAGAEIGPDFRISATGTDGDVTRGAFDAAISYGAASDQYLVSWNADALAADNEYEIFGRMVAKPAPPPATDTDPPETTITLGPKKKTEKSKAKLKFVSDEAGSTFECQLKGKRVKKKLKTFTPCSSPARYLKLKLGKKKFKVRAIDPAGNVDPTPAKKKFKRQ